MTATGIITYLLIWFIHFRFRPRSISPTKLDTFLTSSLCVRLILYPNQFTQLQDQASVTISSEELTYPLAFTILIHSNLDRFDFLLQTIYRKSNYYCILIDLKAPTTLYQAIKDRSSCVTNIYVTDKRINVTWGRFSVLEAEQSCQKELLKH